MRAFVAIRPPQELRQTLWQGFGPVRDLAPGCRWVPAGNIHLTMKFLAEIDARQADAVAATLSDVAARTQRYVARIQGAGVFPGGAAVRVIWAALSDGDPDTVQLAGSIDRALQRLGFPAERRPFRAHLTLARVGDQDRGGLPASARVSLAQIAASDWGAWQVRDLLLMRSRLRPSGPEYDVLAEFPLAEPIAAPTRLC